MTSWRLDLTVLADLAASMFAACFMVLLIFLSLVQKSEAPVPRPIEGRQLNMVERRVPAPAELVELLHDHGSTTGASIDLFVDRVDVLTAGGWTSLRGNGIGSAVAMLGGPVRLYVFSNALYHDVAGALGNRLVTEMSVPRALRDADGRWRPEFLALDAERPELPLFRERLAQLLNGGTAGKGSAGGGGMPVLGAGAGLAERLSTFLGSLAAIGFPILGLAIVLVIERRRYGSGQIVPARGQSLEP